jgi:hypothetical protein
MSTRNCDQQGTQSLLSGKPSRVLPFTLQPFEFSAVSHRVVFRWGLK